MRDVAYVALGSNLGDREHYLSVARDELARLPKTKVLAVTPLEETPPFGPPGQGPYLNQMVAIDTELAGATVGATSVTELTREAGAPVEADSAQEAEFAIQHKPAQAAALGS